MATANLTDPMIRGLIPPASGRTDIVDEKVPGLVLRVSATGVKSWSVRFRDKTSGKTERLTIGRFPTITLAKARDIARARIGDVAEGGNPRAVVRKEKAAHAAGLTFDELADRFLSEYVAPIRPKSLAGYTNAIAPARKAWGKWKARGIAREDVLDLVEKRGREAPIATNRMIAVLSKLFNWSLDLRDPPVSTNPVVRIPKPGVEKARTRVLRDDEIPVLWAAWQAKCAPEVARVYMTLLLTGQRLSEVVEMDRDELIDLHSRTKARWLLPGSRAKNKREHLTPIVPEVGAILKAAISAGGDDTTAVFASRRNPGQFFDRQSFARAMKRLISELEETDETRAAVRRLKADPPTPHDLRRTVATGLGALGTRREVIKAILNHLEGDVTEIYALHDHMDEKRAALAAWAGRVIGLVSKPSGNVHPLRGRA